MDFFIFGHPVVKVKKKIRITSKCTKQKLLEMIQVSVPIFFYSTEILKLKVLGLKNIVFVNSRKMLKNKQFFGHNSFKIRISSK